MSEKYYITTPIYYPNGQPHIGHAYNAIATDSFARFQRLEGKEVFFLSGTDEHGLKMQQTAEREGISPQELADKNSAVFKDMLHILDCSADRFIRTTEDCHRQAAQKLWMMMLENGDIYLDHYQGWYSVRQEAYYDEKDTYIREDGTRVEKEVGSPVVWNEEESYFFRLSKYAQPLLELYEKQPQFILPKERRNEIISFVKSGLKDISISRTSFSWGIKVPDNEKHVMYVWVDALTNYLTGAGFPECNSEKWHLWPADLHVIGKDIIRFHAIFWPAFLLSAKLPLPKQIFAHGFLLNRGEKMSKSVGNVVDPFDLVEKYGLDQLRYFLLREVPFGQDGSYSHELIKQRINADLANDLGNLAQRSLSLLHKHCGGRVPALFELFPQDRKLLQETSQIFIKAREHMHNQAPHLALTTIFTCISEANKYFATEQPWALSKTDLERFSTVIHVTLETLRVAGILLLAFIPGSAHKLLDLLGVAEDQRAFAFIEKGALVPDALLPTPYAIFPRYIEN